MDFLSEKAPSGIPSLWRVVTGGLRIRTTEKNSDSEDDLVIVYPVLDLRQNPESIRDYLKLGDQPEKEWQAADICSLVPVGDIQIANTDVAAAGLTSDQRCRRCLPVFLDHDDCNT